MGLCRPAACSCLCSLASDTRIVWNRAGPIFDALHLVLTNQSKSRGEVTSALCWNIKTRWSQWGHSFKADLTPNRSSSFVGLFFTPQHFCINTSSKTTPNYCLNQRICWMMPFWRFVPVCWGFAINGTASTELQCTCIASVWVHTLVACVYHLLLCLHCCLASTLAFVSWIATSVW